MHDVRGKPRYTAFDVIVDRFLDTAAKSAAEEIRRRRENLEVQHSHKAVIDRLRDENPDYEW